MGFKYKMTGVIIKVGTWCYTIRVQRKASNQPRSGVAGHEVCATYNDLKKLGPGRQKQKDLRPA